MPKRIVYVATHAWRSPVRVGSHHLARAMSRHNQVLYLSHPISIRSIFSRADNQLGIRLKLWKDGVVDVPGEQNLTEANWIMPFAPSPKWRGNSSTLHSICWRWCFPKPKKVFERYGFDRPDELWLDSFFQNYWVELLQPKKLFMRVADHPQYIASMSREMLSEYQQSLQRAERIITPTPAIADFLKQLTDSPVDVVPNGVDLLHFSGNPACPPEYEADPQPKIVFIGALADWIDIELIKAVAVMCKDLSFYLIGPNHNQKIDSMPTNVKLLGSRPYADLPMYLKHAQVAIAPFDVDKQKEFVESIDAIKLYEYVAAGIPTVATEWRQSRSLRPYVKTANQNAMEFSAAIREAIKHPNLHVAPETERSNLDWSSRLEILNL